jgi:hypothetical protein
MSVTVRISLSLRETLRQLAAREGVPMQTVLEKAVESYRRDRLIDELNAGYAKLSSVERDELTDELEVWEATSADGLDSDH